LLGAAGCATDGPGTAGRAETLDVAGAEALPSVARHDWSAAPAGCEGRLADAVSFGVAEGEPELVVALDENHSALCVDTYPALESELTEAGLMDEADRLWLGYLATLQNPELGDAGAMRDIDGRHPTPQPNLVADQDGVNVMVDPSPQTNDGDLLPDPADDDELPDLDPTPQPNSPMHGGASGEDQALSGGAPAPAVTTVGAISS